MGKYDKEISRRNKNLMLENFIYFGEAIMSFGLLNSFSKFWTLILNCDPVTLVYMIED